MSASILVKHPAAREQLDRLIPDYARSLGCEIVVPLPTGASSATIGTAFDYALRFELQRRRPEAVDTGWVAETALESLHEAAQRMAAFERAGRARGVPVLDDPRKMLVRAELRVRKYPFDESRRCLPVASSV